MMERPFVGPLPRLHDTSYLIEIDAGGTWSHFWTSRLGLGFYAEAGLGFSLSRASISYHTSFIGHYYLISCMFSALSDGPFFRVSSL